MLELSSEQMISRRKSETASAHDNNFIARKDHVISIVLVKGIRDEKFLILALTLEVPIARLY